MNRCHIQQSLCTQLNSRLAKECFPTQAFADASIDLLLRQIVDRDCN